jgi:hypothetical protein
VTLNREKSDEFWETPLPSCEFARRERESRARRAGPEGDEMRATLEWFLRRYPTPLARIAYTRRKTREARAFQESALRCLETGAPKPPSAR